MITKSYKMSEETAAKIDAMKESLQAVDPSASWDNCFEVLARAYNSQTTAQAAGRAEDAADFRALLGRVEESYNAILAGIVTAKERAEAEAGKRLEAMQRKIEVAEAASDTAREIEEENKALKQENEETRKRAEDAEMERDETRAINKRLLGELEKAEAERAEIDDLQRKAAAADALQAEKEKQADLISSYENKLKDYETKLQEAETRYKDMAAELKGRYNEKLETAAAAAANETQSARLDEREKLMKEMDALRADFALKLAAVTAAAQKHPPEQPQKKEGKNK